MSTRRKAQNSPPTTEIEMTQYPTVSYHHTRTALNRRGSFDGTVSARGNDFNNNDVGELASLTFHHSGGRKDTDINTVQTDEPYRGRGIGGTLMAHAEVIAKREGSTKMVIPMAAPKAQPLYERQGYKKVAQHSPTMEKKI